jgi:AcrR family transcriptional regulator
VRTNVKRRGPGRPGKDRPNGALLLLKAGQSAFARHGFEGASLRGIATAAGVDPALAAHHFGSKEALWEAVIERLALYLAPYTAELRELQTQREIPIRMRVETAFRQLISSACEEPEAGMLISRISAERGRSWTCLSRNYSALITTYLNLSCWRLCERRSSQSNLLKCSTSCFSTLSRCRSRSGMFLGISANHTRIY